MAIWIAQFVGREIRLLDYIEGVGQPLAYYAHELRRRGWNDVIVYLPHDGVATNNITGKRWARCARLLPRASGREAQYRFGPRT